MEMKEEKSFWTVADIDQRFKSQKDAKFFCYYGFTENERWNFLDGNDIAHFANGKLISLTKIRVNKKNLCVFSKPKLI